MAIRILRPKALLGFTLAMMLSLTTASLVFIILKGFSDTLNYSFGGFMGGLVILQDGAKSIHTSRVPESIAESLRWIPGVEARKVTLTPLTLHGSPLTVRGVEDHGEYLKNLVEGENPGEGGLWILFGERAFRRLGLRIGELIPLGSPSSTNILTLKVAGVYRFNDMRDYEAVVPLEVGVELAGLPKGTVSAVGVEGLDRGELESLIRTQYTLTLIYEGGRGYVTILDSLNTPAASFKVEGAGSQLLHLPFGYYTIIYREAYLTANITSLLLKENRTITLGALGGGVYHLRVVAPEAGYLTLQGEGDLPIPGRWEGGSWIFEAPQGLYTLIIDGESYLVPLMGETTFNPALPSEAVERAVIRVQWQDGADVTDYLISIWNAEGVLVASIRSLSPEVSINLPPGGYEAEVSKPPYTSRARFSLPGEEVRVVLPSISSPGRITPRLFQQLKALAPIEASSATLTSLIGLTASSITALALSLALLSMIAVFTVQRGLQRSAMDNLEVLAALGAGRRETLRFIWLKLLGLNLALGLGSALTALLIYKNLYSGSGFTFLGYGLEPDPTLTLIYSLTLSVASWLLIQARQPLKYGMEA